VDQAGAFRLDQGVVVGQTKAGGRGVHFCRRTAAGRGRDQEHRPGGRAELVQAHGEPLPDRRAGLERHLGKLGTSELLGGERGRQFYERQRVTGGLGVQPLNHLEGRRDPGGGFDEALRRIAVDSGYLEAGQAGGRGAVGAQGQEARDRITI
jgi:hypothetical protein